MKRFWPRAKRIVCLSGETDAQPGVGLSATYLSLSVSVSVANVYSSHHRFCPAGGPPALPPRPRPPTCVSSCCCCCCPPRPAPPRPVCCCVSPTSSSPVVDTTFDSFGRSTLNRTFVSFSMNLIVVIGRCCASYGV